MIVLYVWAVVVAGIVLCIALAYHYGDWWHR